MNRRSFLGQSSRAAGLCFAGISQVARASSAKSHFSPIVQTTAGKIRGVTQVNALVFKGIPYGDSTEGAGRFQPPGKVMPWTGVRETVMFGAPSPQLFSNLIPESMAQVPDEERRGTEHCLHLNVWTASLRGNRPVMVWEPFHTGRRATMIFDNECVAVDDPHREERLARAAVKAPDAA